MREEVRSLSVRRESHKRRTINQNRTLCVVRYRWNRNKRGPRALVPILNVNISRHGQNWACYVIVDFSAPWTTASARARENSAALWNISGLLKRPLGIESCYYVHMHRTIDLKDYMNSTICVPLLCELLA